MVRVGYHSLKYAIVSANVASLSLYNANEFPLRTIMFVVPTVLSVYTVRPVFEPSIAKISL